MPDAPNYIDAVILIALVWGSGPEQVLGATDHLNAGYAEYPDWIHACKVLGKLGLLVTGEPLPSLTSAGAELVARFLPPNAAPRPAAKKLVDHLSSMPNVADPVSPSETRVIEEAIEACGRRFTLWQEEQARKALIPNRRDAAILVSLCLGRDSRTTPPASVEEGSRPGIADWQHIGEAFGRRGLIENDGEVLRTTPSGSALVDTCRANLEGDHDLLRRVVDYASELPVVFPTVPIPSWPTIWKLHRGPSWPWLSIPGSLEIDG